LLCDDVIDYFRQLLMLDDDGVRAMPVANLNSASALVFVGSAMANEQSITATENWKRLMLAD
jgi:hypothetical protein